jgi:8-oxo-dGTP diphosphatase
MFAPGTSSAVVFSNEVSMHVNARALIERSKDDQAELLLQVRNKPYEGRTSIELPGGRVEEYESLIDALRREMREETGLELSFIQGLESRIETNGADANVECLQPFAVYQTLRGPVDSVGVYFLCRAEGELAESGDETEHPRWMPVSEIALRLEQNPEQFSFVDRAGLVYYLKHT